MRKPIIAALAALLMGTTLMQGCYIGPWWHDHDRGYRDGDERREEYHHRERDGALTPPTRDRQQYDARVQGNAPAFHNDDNGSNG